MIERLAELRKNVKWQCDESPQPHEATYLKLDGSKARTQLGWHPRWRLRDALVKTLEWHEAWRRAENMRSVTLEQIAAYQSIKREL